jgi:hypothetical protein
MVDIERRAAEAWTPDATFPTIERERLLWRPEGAKDGLVIPPTG